MINRKAPLHSYFIARGEILGFMRNELLRQHLLTWDSSRSKVGGLEDDQIHS